jgi:polyisoprenoid-binding protein YceI
MVRGRHGAVQQCGSTLEFDAADPAHSSVVVTIPLTSMSTGVPDLNDDFRSSATLSRSDFGLGLYVPQVEAAEKNAYEQYLKAQAAREAAKKTKQ